MRPVNLLRVLLALLLALLLSLVLQVVYGNSPWMQSHLRATRFFLGGDETPAPAALSPTASPAAGVSTTGTAKVQALFRDLASGRRNRLRILYYSDSITEGEVITGTLRKDLQRRFGGRGPGFHGIAPRDAGDRPDVTLLPGKGWRRQALPALHDEPGLALGPQGEDYTIDGDDSAIEMVHAPKDAAKPWYRRATLYTGPGSFHLEYSGGGVTTSVQAHGTKNFNAYLLRVHPGAPLWLRITPRSDGTLFYGLSLDSATGVLVDTATMRGDLGEGPSHIPAKVLEQAQASLHWDVVFLHFGLNVLQPGQTSFAWYRAQLRKSIHHLRTHLRGAQIVVVGVADHTVRGADGSLDSDPSIPYVLQAQAKAAADEKAAFIDLFADAGGPGVMRRWVEQSPALAYKDYMHLNRRGGAVVAGILEKDLIPEALLGATPSARAGAAP